MNTENVDVLVIGAGPSGTIAASIVNKAGFKVKIVEKMKFPRFVMGEVCFRVAWKHLKKQDF